MLDLNSIMLGTSNPKELIAFYEKLFDRKPDMVEGNNSGWAIGKTFFAVGEHSEVKGESKDPSRLIFNFETKEVREEFERIVKIGAKVIKEPYEMGGAWIATLADPDGNYFQLMTPWESK